MKCTFIIFTVLAIATFSFATGSDNDRGPEEDDYQLSRDDISAIEDGERKSLATAGEATELIFDTIKAEQGVRFIHGFEESDERCPVVIDAIEKKVYEGYQTSVGTYFDVESIIRPKVSKTIAKARALAFADLKAAIAGIMSGVVLIDEFDGDEVRIKINKIEKETVEVSANVMRNVYVPILKGYDSSTAIGAKLLRAEDKTVSAITNSIKGIFYAIRSVLAKLFPDVDFGVSYHSSFNTIKNNTLAGFHVVVTSVYEADRILVDAYSTKPEYN